LAQAPARQQAVEIAQVGVLVVVEEEEVDATGTEAVLSGEGVEGLFKHIDRVAGARRLRIPTAELNRWLADTDIGRSSAPSSQSPEVLYLTQASTDPPTFVLFTRGTNRIHFSFERFLQNRLRERFDFTGTPIRFIIRTRAQKPRRARAG